MALVFVFHFLTLLLLAAGDGNGYHGECPASFDCGSFIGNISFPFTITQRQDCGLLAIQNCEDPLKPKSIQLQNNGEWFEVVRVSHHTPTNATFLFRDTNLYKLFVSKSCESFRYSYTFPSTPTFHFGSFRIKNATLFRCNHNLRLRPPADMLSYTSCPAYDVYYYPFITDESPTSMTPCTRVHLPIKDAPNSTDPFTFLTSDIITEVKLTDECANCHYDKRGHCQLDTTHRFVCTTATTNTSILPQPPLYVAEKKTGKKVLIVAIAASLAGVVVMMVLVCCFGTKIFPPTYLLFWKENPTHQIIEKFLKEHGHLPTARYSYLEVKKITNFFRNKLGQGGFGCVYKGKLHDGRLVAVKILSESKGNGEDFINEVATISRTLHVNIIRLLGFCLSDSKMALIYEFMPNGSLEKFIYEEKNPLEVDHRLDCKTLYDIAIGVARGLEYLHRGCNTRILHFDIKPHNILLDVDFCPKISDFGLTEICTRKESIVSQFGPRGTIRYIAPELIYRDFGGVSYKSDVYSYGMMFLEMVGRRKNINVAVDHSSEIYFPDWIYKRLELNQELGLQYIKNEIDEEMVRKMIVVSLWCIQTDPSKRPTMSKVVKMLEGSLEVLQIPPKLSLFSSSTSSTHSTFDNVLKTEKIELEIEPM